MSPDLRWRDVSEGAAIPPLVDEITYRRVVMNPGATGDYFPGHYDPDYARRQGQPTIYANSLHLFGLLDRAVTEWAGPRTFLARRAVRLVSSMYAGDTVTVHGVVTGKRADGDDDPRDSDTGPRGSETGPRDSDTGPRGSETGLVDLDLTITAQDGRVICTAAVSVRLTGAP